MMPRLTGLNKITLLAVLALSLTLTACQGSSSPKKEVQPEAAVSSEVQTAVETYLRDVKGLDSSKMNIALSAFTEKDGGATCRGAITLRNGGDMPPMEYIYTLKKGESGWTVIASTPKGGTGHAAMPLTSAMPEGHPTVDGMNSHAGATGAPPLESAHGTPQPAPSEKK